MLNLWRFVSRISSERAGRPKEQLFRRNAMKVAQHFSAGLAFLNASVPFGTAEFGGHPPKNGPRCSKIQILEAGPTP
jgi:hypothetical protein